ncbi:MAG: choice-of-anchor B family protein [Flavobacteriaceae bacterium]
MKRTLFSLLLLFPLFSFSQTPCSGGMAGIFPCDGYDLQSRLNLTDLNAGSGNDSWGWTDPDDGTEYALMGLNNGTAFIDISDPVNPVYLGKLPTHTSSSLWRDIKVYNNYAFIVSEANNHGMQVFDLTRLRNVTNPPVTFTEDAHFNGFGHAHNIVINEDTGYAYPVGTSFFNGGPWFINIQDPLNPVSEGGYGMDDYSHDAQVVTYSGPDTDYTGHEILIGSNETEVVIVDVTNKANPVGISTISYTNVGYTHQGWFTEDERYFILGDELDEQNIGFNTRTIIFDFEDLDNPQIHFQYTGATPAIDHNGYVKGDKYYMANYRAGIRVLDISDIANSNMTEIGSFDTYPNNNNASFNGAWSVYPYFGSGNIVISDIDRGFFLVKASGVDNEDPVAVCQDYTAALGANGEVIIAGSDVDGGSTDNSGFVSFSVVPNTFDCSDIGTPVTVTLTVTDPSGNSDTCTAIVTVVDEMGPAFDCYANETVAYDTGENFYTLPDYVANNDVTATDNCTSPLTIAQDPMPGTQLTEGVYTISFESTDDEGNTATCSFELTVQAELGIMDRNFSQGVSLFPNPTATELQVKSSNGKITSLSIIDITGKNLRTVENISVESTTLDTSLLSNGVYFVVLNGNTTKKIVKQ